jgi:hypothetical protein
VVHGVLAESLDPFVTASIAHGARVITDGWQGYAGLRKLGYVHERRSQRAGRPCPLAAAGHDPVRYRDLTLGKRPRKIPPAPPPVRGYPPSLERSAAERP